MTAPQASTPTGATGTPDAATDAIAGALQPPEAPSRHTLVAQNIGWTLAHQVAQAIISFAAMLVLVRILTPADYGHAAAIVGILTVLNAFGCASFINYALQLPEHEEPDWSQHLQAGLYIQLTLSMVCHALAGALWLVPGYRTVAPLLHIAAVGLLIDAPNRLGMAMLQRNLAFRRLRLIQTVGLLMSTAVTLVLAMAGTGAYALVIGMNVVTALPFAFDLLVVGRWRPQAGWYSVPDLQAYRPALRFGMSNAGSALLHSARGGLEAALLPAALGFPAIGLLGRAHALFLLLVWRVVNPVLETIYPLLPRAANNPVVFRRSVTLLAQGVLLCVVPGATFIALHGPLASRVLYGSRWVAADPLLAPAGLFGMGMALFAIGANVIMARTEMQRLLRMYGVNALLSGIMTVAALLHRDVVAYAWSLAAAQLLAGGMAFKLAVPHFGEQWLRLLVLPPLTITAVAAAVSSAAIRLVHAPAGALLLLSFVAFVTVAAATLRLLFPAAMLHLLSVVPRGRLLVQWLRLGHA